MFLWNTSQQSACTWAIKFMRTMYLTPAMRFLLQRWEIWGSDRDMSGSFQSQFSRFVIPNADTHSERQPVDREEPSLHFSHRWIICEHKDCVRSSAAFLPHAETSGGLSKCLLTSWSPPEAAALLSVNTQLFHRVAAQNSHFWPPNS